jgi:hypothetical protein
MFVYIRLQQKVTSNIAELGALISRNDFIEIFVDAQVIRLDQLSGSLHDIMSIYAF